MSWEDEKLERFRTFFEEDADTAGEGGEAPGERRRIGRYRLMEVIGEGGMGVVFRAYDEHLRRDAALKMLKTAQSYSPTQIERFRRECFNVARLRHPNIVTLYDVGREGDAVYYTMEIVPGRPFDAVEGTLEERIRILEKVARAVQYAHEQGVIHRDLKPGNILVDDRGEPHLLDFGLSRDVTTSSDLSRDGSTFGTPFYMAPEQAAGHVREVDARSDVWALGIILYETVAKRVPFTGNAIAEIVRSLAADEPPPLEGPPALEAICFKALQKDPSKRYSTVAKFADELARYLADQPVQAKPPVPLRRFARRLAIPMILAVALAAITLATVLRFAPRPEPVPAAPPDVFFDDFDKGMLSPVWSAQGVADKDVSGTHVMLSHSRQDIDAGRPITELTYRMSEVETLAVEIKFDGFEMRNNCRFKMALGADAGVFVFDRWSLPGQQLLQFVATAEGKVRMQREVIYPKDAGFLKLEYDARTAELKAYYKPAAAAEYREMATLSSPDFKEPYFVSLTTETWESGGPSVVKLDWVRITTTPVGHY